MDPSSSGRTAVAASAVRSGSSFRQLATTFREMKAFPLTLWFLGAYLLFNDGVQTVIGVAAQFGDDELGLSQTTLVSTILLVQLVAFVGAVALGRIAQAVGAKRTVRTQVALAARVAPQPPATRVNSVALSPPNETVPICTACVVLVFLSVKA